MIRLSCVLVFGLLTTACGESTTPGGGDAGPDVDWAACEARDECVVLARACCASCGAPPTLADVEGGNRSSEALAAHRMQYCEPGVPACPPCAPAVNPNLVASCGGDNRCEVFDVAAEYAECTAPDDCVVRVRDCCACGADVYIDNLIAIAAGSVGEYTTRICEPDGGCATCEPIYPETVSATCNAGRCELLVEMMSGP